jgi:hypothetical protein
LDQDLPKDLERDNSFMLSDDDPAIQELFGELRTQSSQISKETETADAAKAPE